MTTVACWSCGSRTPIEVGDDRECSVCDANLRRWGQPWRELLEIEARVRIRDNLEPITEADFEPLEHWLDVDAEEIAEVLGFSAVETEPTSGPQGTPPAGLEGSDLDPADRRRDVIALLVGGWLAISGLVLGLILVAKAVDVANSTDLGVLQEGMPVLALASLALLGGALISYTTYCYVVTAKKGRWPWFVAGLLLSPFWVFWFAPFLRDRRKGPGHQTRWFFAWPATRHKPPGPGLVHPMWTPAALTGAGLPFVLIGVAALNGSERDLLERHAAQLAAISERLEERALGAEQDAARLEDQLLPSQVQAQRAAADVVSRRCFNTVEENDRHPRNVDWYSVLVALVQDAPPGKVLAASLHSSDSESVCLYEIDASAVP